MILGKEIGVLEVVLFFTLLTLVRDGVAIFVSFKMKIYRQPESIKQYSYRIAWGTLATVPLLLASRYLPGYLSALIGALYILTLLFIFRKWLK